MRTAALLPRGALRTGFLLHVHPCLCRGGSSPACASVSPALKRGNCFFWGSAPNIQQGGKEKGGKKSCGKQKRDGAESWEGRRAAGHTSRLARCPPRLRLAPRFPWLPPTFLQGNSWPGLQTAGGGWQSGCWLLWVSDLGGQHADIASAERDKLGYVFTSCFLVCLFGFF